jgi:cytoskeleton protein RodZ
MIEPEETEFSSTTSELSGASKKVHSFGERLFLAREQQGLTVQEVAKATHLSGEIIEAIERSDVNNLPQPTYVQGYIRAYAKFIDIPAETVLEEYNRIAPHVSETKLAPPQIQSHGPNSSTPLVKAVSLLLLIVIIMAGIYGVFSHYSEIVETMHKEPVSVDVDGLDITLPDQMGIDVEDNETGNMDAAVVDDSVVDAPSTEALVENRRSENALIQERVIGSDTERAALIEIQPIAKGDDVINLVAHKASWVEVIDGNGVKLHYNLVTAGKSIVLRGTAPFDIFLGNAPAVDIKMNDVEIDTTRYVRSNNIAHFKISMNDDEQIVFH